MTTLEPAKVVTVTLGHLVFTYIGKGGLIHSKWVMIMDFARIKKERGFLPLRILDHVTYMYFLAFFLDKDNPRKQGKTAE